MKFASCVLSALLLGLGGNAATQDEEIAVTRIPSQLIWDAAPHNAFTDLVRFKGQLYCTFREAEGHVPKGADDNGKCRVLRSRDGDQWESVGLLEETGRDLRDPKLSVTPDGRLMVVMGGSVYLDGVFQSRAVRVSFSSADGSSFEPPQPARIDPSIARHNDWLWRVTWNEGIAWGIVYQPNANPEECGLHLVRSTDGLDWRLAKTFELDDSPNEATLRFAEDGRMIALVRRGSGQRRGLIGHASPPYAEWSWSTLDVQLGGPDLILLPGDRLLAGTRSYGDGYRTVLMEVGLDGSTKLLAELPSEGDTSYPGLVLDGEELLVSYYSSHAQKTAIYFARVPLATLDR